ncbi:hypothetical protein AVEN_124905-1 [Araneus ventricosus]|uniref:Uncharacterized protein n=1 Tax=Araneus ventricosus TaxID=182803 RepID=A0A4Y2NC17_ARAVE|nr:hypothetical protein AVEN_124905-1 [Araneus ventricosus]
MVISVSERSKARHSGELRSTKWRGSTPWHFTFMPIHLRRSFTGAQTTNPSATATLFHYGYCAYSSSIFKMEAPACSDLLKSERASPRIYTGRISALKAQ